MQEISHVLLTQTALKSQAETFMAHGLILP